METKSISLVFCLVVYLGSASLSSNKYSAGVDPEICPYYPYCDNELLGAHARAVSDTVHAYSALTYTATYGQTPKVKGYLARFNLRSCPNYQYCGPSLSHDHYKAWSYATPSDGSYDPTAVISYAASAGDAYALIAKRAKRFRWRYPLLQ